MTASNSLINALKKEGLRYTNQRQAVWDEIKSNEDHRDAEEIFSALRKNNLNVSRATVYRTIDVLYKNNLIRKIELGDSPAKYENKVNSEHHDHIICVQCGKIEEFVDEIPWVHLDIAGPARARSSSALNPEGGTGFGVIGLVNFFKLLSKNPQ